MENENLENINSTNDELEVDSSEPVEQLPDEPEESQDTSDKAEELRAELEKLRKENKTLKIQKAKAREKAEQRPAQTVELSQLDLYAMVQHQVPQEDVSDVLDYARLKGVGVQEALQSSIVKTILAEKAESRRVANASNTGTTRKVQKQTPDDVLLENARKGQLPESDGDLARLVEARMEAKRQRRK